jgi:hypothetical protein
VIALWWFGFHPRDTIRDAWRKRQWSMFTHVEAWGCTRDGAWLFFDPLAAGTRLQILADPDAVDEAMARRFLLCESILRLPAPETRISFPAHPTMNCVSQCAHLIGVRAYSPGGFHRILRALGAKEIQDAAQDGPIGESCARG